MLTSASTDTGTTTRVENTNTTKQNKTKQKRSFRLQRPKIHPPEYQDNNSYAFSYNRKPSS
jgi:hypothetical protein